MTLPPGVCESRLVRHSDAPTTSFRALALCESRNPHAEAPPSRAVWLRTAIRPGKETGRGRMASAGQARCRPLATPPAPRRPHVTAPLLRPVTTPIRLRRRGERTGAPRRPAPAGSRAPWEGDLAACPPQDGSSQASGMSAMGSAPTMGRPGRLHHNAWVTHRSGGDPAALRGDRRPNAQPSADGLVFTGDKADPP